MAEKLGKRARARRRARLARIEREKELGLVPQYQCRSAWSKNGMSVARKPRKAWGYDANKARSLHKPYKVRHI